MSSSQKAALRYVEEKFDSALSKPSIYWPTVPHKNLEWEIVSRIKDPDRIWQATSNLCGMASFMNTLAWDDPYLYGHYVCNLLQYGSAILGYQKDSPRISPTKATRSSKVPPTMPTADWVALASLRDHLNKVLDYSFDAAVPVLGEIPLLGLFGSPRLTGEPIGGITLPKDLVHMLKAVGYTKVVDLADWKYKPEPKVMGLANAYFAAGYRVLLLVNSGIYSPSASSWSMLPTHWVRMTAKFDQRGSKVRARVYDPAAGCQRWLPESDSGAYLPLASFLGHFWGFVAGRR